MKSEEDEAFDELAKRQGAWGGGFKAKQAMAADKQHWNEDEGRRNNWRCGHGWLRGEQCEICNAAQEPVECLDCGSHNIGILATYDSLVNSVKAQPVQEPVAYVTGMSFGRFIVEPLNPAMVLPVGMALYSSPQGNT